MNPTPGIAAFGGLRAEDEPWLSACYEPPADFALMADARSAVIYGEVGGGMTALRLALERAWAGSSHEPGWLLVHWPANVLIGADAQLVGSSLAARQQAQVFVVTARALARHVIQRPHTWYAAPPWARTTVAWFVRRYLAGGAETILAALADDNPATDLTIVRDLLAPDSADLLDRDAPPVLVIEEVARALPRFGLMGVRIITEDVQPWWAAYPDQLADALRAFLATLSLFEHERFRYALFLPAALAPILSRASGVVRRRLQVFSLRFQESELVRIVERRLAFALGRELFALADLGPADALRQWLMGCGGVAPRGWLEAARPFLAAYLSLTVSNRPLSLTECRDLQRQHPPALWVDSTTDDVIVGWRRIGGLGTGHLALLRYLISHANIYCSRHELNIVYEGALYPESKLMTRARANDYTSSFDNALWRLRGLVEPDPTAPVLLETKKGQGVRLRLACEGDERKPQRK